MNTEDPGIEEMWVPEEQVEALYAISDLMSASVVEGEEWDVYIRAGGQVAVVRVGEDGFDKSTLN